MNVFSYEIENMLQSIFYEAQGKALIDLTIENFRFKKKSLVLHRTDVLNYQGQLIRRLYEFLF